MPSIRNPTSIDDLLNQILRQPQIQYNPNIKISDEAKDLISQMLVIDADKRMNFVDFFNNKWVKAGKQVNQADDLDQSMIQDALKSVYDNTKRQ